MTKAEKAAYDRLRYQRHRERILTMTRAYQAANVDAVRAQKADYYARNRERIRAVQDDYRCTTAGICARARAELNLAYRTLETP